jgi:hypothetical protein
MKRLSQILFLLALALLALPNAAVLADDFSTTAFDNATVQPMGPRPAPNGKNYFNMEGTDNGNFSSYGVADFDSTTLGISLVTEIDAVTITLVQDDAGFSTAGAINFYITEDNVTSIQPDDNAVIFDNTDPEGLNGQLSPIHFLGSGLFDPSGGSSTVDTFSFVPDADTAAYLIDLINNGGTIRIVITPVDPAVSATYAGFSDPNGYTGPTITITGF